MAAQVNGKVIEMVSPAQKQDKAERECVERIIGHISPKPPPLKELPTWLQDLVNEISTSVQVRPEMVLSSLLGAIATPAQGLCLVKIDSKRVAPLSLFILIIAISGDGKSQTDDETFGGAKRWVANELKAKSKELKKYEAELASWKAEQKGLESLIAKCSKESKADDLKQAKEALLKLAEREPKKPLVADLFVSDATHESLTGKSGLLDYPLTIIQTDEGAIFFGGAAFNSSSSSTSAMGKYCQLWSNKGFEIKRESTGKMVVSNVGLSICVSAQPVILDDLFERQGKKVRESGWFARALICQPETMQGSRPYRAPSGEEPYTVEFNRRVAELMGKLEGHITEDRRLKRNVLTLSDAALTKWIEYHDDVDKERRTGGRFEFIRSEAARAAENAARIAANLHVYEKGETGEISEEHMKAGCALAAWYLSESKRFIYRHEMPPQFRLAAEISPRIAAFCRKNKAAGNKDWEAITIRQVLSSCSPAEVKTEKDLKPIVVELMDSGHILDYDNESRYPRLIINPDLVKDKPEDE